MKNLKVKIDNNSGFCFGVEFAIEMAEDILKTDKQLYCLGDIVHNNKEVERLSNMGLRIINHDDLSSLIIMRPPPCGDSLCGPLVFRQQP